MNRASLREEKVSQPLEEQQTAFGGGTVAPALRNDVRTGGRGRQQKVEQRLVIHERTLSAVKVGQFGQRREIVRDRIGILDDPAGRSPEGEAFERREVGGGGIRQQDMGE